MVSGGETSPLFVVRTNLVLVMRIVEAVLSGYYGWRNLCQAIVLIIKLRLMSYEDNYNVR